MSSSNLLDSIVETSKFLKELYPLDCMVSVMTDINNISSRITKAEDISTVQAASSEEISAIIVENTNSAAKLIDMSKIL